MHDGRKVVEGDVAAVMVVVAGCWVDEIGFWEDVVGCCIGEVGSWEDVVSFWVDEVGFWEDVVGVSVEDTSVQTLPE